MPSKKEGPATRLLECCFDSMVASWKQINSCPVVTQLIPEGFVDIIRRLTPRSHGLDCSLFPDRISQRIFDRMDQRRRFFIVFLLLSYETGLVLDALVTDFAGYGFFKWWAWRDFDSQQRRHARAMRRVLNLKEETDERDTEPCFPRAGSLGGREVAGVESTRAFLRAEVVRSDSTSS